MISKLRWTAATATLTLLLWAAAAAYLSKEYLLPKPTSVATVLTHNAALFSQALLYTFTEAVGGLLIAIVAAVLLAVAIFMYPSTEHFVMPYAIAVKSTPVVALAPLLAVWFGPDGWSGWAGRTLMAALISFFPILQYVTDALRSAPEPARLYSRVLGTTRSRDLRLIRMWFAIPAFASSLKVASPLAVVGALVAEFLGSDRGVGHLLFAFVLKLRTAEVFASVITVAATGWTLYAASAWLEHRALTALHMERELRRNG